MSVCRSCRAPVMWVQTEAREGKPSKSMPLDATDEGRLLVVEAGNIVLTEDQTARVVATGQGQYQSHFASCPHAREHRKR